MKLWQRTKHPTKWFAIGFACPCSYIPSYWGYLNPCSFERPPLIALVLLLFSLNEVDQLDQLSSTSPLKVFSSFWHLFWCCPWRLCSHATLQDIAYLRHHSCNGQFGRSCTHSPRLHSSRRILRVPQCGRARLPSLRRYLKRSVAKRHQYPWENMSQSVLQAGPMGIWTGAKRLSLLQTCWF